MDCFAGEYTFDYIAFFSPYALVFNTDVSECLQDFSLLLVGPGVEGGCSFQLILMDKWIVTKMYLGGYLKSIQKSPIKQADAMPVILLNSLCRLCIARLVPDNSLLTANFGNTSSMMSAQNWPEGWGSLQQCIKHIYN